MEPHPSHTFKDSYCTRCRCLDIGRGITWEPCRVPDRIDWLRVTREVVLPEESQN